MFLCITSLSHAFIAALDLLNTDICWTDAVNTTRLLWSRPEAVQGFPLVQIQKSVR